MKTANKETMWHAMKVCTNNLFATYSAKYGPDSNYAAMQEIEYAHPEVRESLEKALGWAAVQEGDVLLHIGVNNGLELSFFKDAHKEIWPTLTIFGIDLVRDALLQATKKFSEPFIHFLHGDARDLGGVHVQTGKSIEIEENSVDLVVALTSLQSSSFQSDLPDFVESVVSKMRPNARMLIAVPDCHVVDREMVKGQFDANTQRIDHNAAEKFCGVVSGLLSEKGFTVQRTGEHFRFLVFSRV